MAVMIAIWVLAIVGSLAILGNKDPIDRLRIVTCWTGGFAAWALVKDSWGWTLTQVVAGVIVLDAAITLTMISLLIAYRLITKLAQGSST